MRTCALHDTRTLVRYSIKPQVVSRPRDFEHSRRYTERDGYSNSQSAADLKAIRRQYHSPMIAAAGGELTRPPTEAARDAAFPSNAAQGAAMLVASVNKLGFVDDARSTICRGQRFFALNVICLFLPAGWAKRRQSFGKRFVRGGTTLFACCVDKLIDQPA